jgi:hypothetical protein
MAFPSPNSLSAASHPTSSSSSFHLHLQLQQPVPHLPFPRSLPLNLPVLRLARPLLPPAPLASSGSGGIGIGGGGDDDEGRDNAGGGDGGDDDASVNRRESLFVLAQLGRKLESLPADLAAAIEGGRVPGEIVQRFADLEKSGLFRWLLQFGGFKERLLADDLFLAKVAMECGVGIFTKTAAEYERRRENFVKELDFVIADVVMAIVADFMLVWLPAPTVSLQPPLAVNAGSIAKFFHNCPDNAFQVALAGTSYSLLQRVGAIMVSFWAILWPSQLKLHYFSRLFLLSNNFASFRGMVQNFLQWELVHP